MLWVFSTQLSRKETFDRISKAEEDIAIIMHFIRSNYPSVLTGLSNLNF